MKSFFTKLYLIIFILLSLLITVYFWDQNFYSYHLVLIIFLGFIIVNSFFSTKNQKIIFYNIFFIIIIIYFFEFFTNREKYKKLNFYLKLFEKNKEIMLSYSSNNLLTEKEINLFPLSGISNVETIHCNENGYFSVYKSDRYGFNNLDKNHDEQIIDYVFIGDSFVQGACVNFNNTFTYLVEKRLNKKIINFAMDGNGPLINYAALKEFFPQNSTVKNVVYFYTEKNDLEDLLLENENNILKRYLEDENYSQNLLDKVDLVNSILKVKISSSIEKFKLQNNSFLNFITLYNIRTFVMPFFYIGGDISIKKSVDNEEILETFQNIVLEMKNFSVSKKSNFFLIYLPSFEKLALNKDNTWKYYDKNIDFFKKNNINYIDATLFFKEYDDPLIFFARNQDLHFNEIGYQKISDFISKKLLLK